jgi:hypothetical protein
MRQERFSPPLKDMDSIRPAEVTSIRRAPHLGAFSVEIASVEREGLGLAERRTAQTTRACARADRIQTRRRHPTLVRTEVMLDTKPVIEAELIA